MKVLDLEFTTPKSKYKVLVSHKCMQIVDYGRDEVIGTYKTLDLEEIIDIIRKYEGGELEGQG